MLTDCQDANIRSSASTAPQRSTILSIASDVSVGGVIQHNADLTCNLWASSLLPSCDDNVIHLSIVTRSFSNFELVSWLNGNLLRKKQTRDIWKGYIKKYHKRILHLQNIDSFRNLHPDAKRPEASQATISRLKWKYLESLSDYMEIDPWLKYTRTVWLQIYTFSYPLPPLALIIDELYFYQVNGTTICVDGYAGVHHLLSALAGWRYFKLSQSFRFSI